MKRVLVFLITLCIILLGKAVQASGYNVLVIPTGIIGTSHNHMFGKTDIEELLTRSLIWHMEDMDIANAPSITTLKISIKNNPNYDANAIDPFNNLKAIAKSYGVTKVMLVSTKLEIQSNSDQKKFWNKLDLPVITPVDSNLRIVTKIQLINPQTNEILWNDMYYKNTDTLGIGVNGYSNSDSKLNAIMAYYDNLSVKILTDIKNSKETKAVMIPTDEEKKELKPMKLIKRSGVNVTIPISKTKTNLNPIDVNKGQKNTSKINTIKDNVKHKVETSKQKKEEQKFKKELNEFSQINIQKEEKSQIKNENYVETSDIDTLPTTNFMHIKPRKNSRNYLPKFDSSINDI